MRIAAYLDKVRSGSRGRTRSATPGVISLKSNRLNLLEIDNFFDRENAKIPLRNAPVIKEESGNQEYVTQLKLLKTQFNRSKIDWAHIESHLNKTKSDMQKLDNSEKEAQIKQNNLEEKFKSLEKELEKIKKDYDFALVDHNNYLHIKDRLSITSVFMDIKLNTMRDQLKTRDQLVQDEERKKLKTAEINGRFIRRYRNFSVNYISDDRKRQLVTTQLDRDITNKQLFTTKREEMEKRRLEIAEAVENEDKNRRYNFLREGLLLHKTWFDYLNSKLTKETKKFHYIEKAYATIRSVTGLTNIHEVVQKILTRENSYTSLMNMILENKGICENYQRKNMELEDEMNVIIMRDKDLLKINDTTFKRNAAKLLKKLAAAKEKVSKLKGVQSYIASWAKGVIRKIMPDAHLENENLRGVFLFLKRFIQDNLKNNKASGINKVPLEAYSAQNFRRRVTNLDGLRISDFIYSEEESIEIGSPTDKNLKKKLKKGYNK